MWLGNLDTKPDMGNMRKNYRPVLLMNIQNVSKTNPVVYLNIIMPTVLQYNSDITYPELASDSTGIRAQSPTKLPSFEMPITSLGVPRPLILLTGCESKRIPTTPLSFDHSLK